MNFASNPKNLWTKIRNHKKKDWTHCHAIFAIFIVHCGYFHTQSVYLKKINKNITKTKIRTCFRNQEVLITIMRTCFFYVIIIRFKFCFFPPCSTVKKMFFLAYFVPPIWTPLVLHLGKISRQDFRGFIFGGIYSWVGDLTAVTKSTHIHTCFPFAICPHFAQNSPFLGKIPAGGQFFLGQIHDPNEFGSWNWETKSYGLK